MDARITKEETALLLNLSASPATREVENLRLAAMRMRDEAVGTAIMGGIRTMFRSIGAALAFVAAYPERARVLRQLGSLTDRELADIGLDRSDLGRVFDADSTIGKPAQGANQAHGMSGGVFAR